MAESVTMQGTEHVDQPTKGTRFREQTTKVKDDLRELGKLGREASAETLDKARETAGHYVEQGKKRAVEIEDSVVTYVRNKPVKSLAMAIGAGAVLGYLIKRR